jgi:integrase
LLAADDARDLLASIKITRTVKRAGLSREMSDITACATGALIGVMVYTFARVNAVLQMKGRDYFVQGRRGWARLHEKGGKERESPLPPQS